MSAWKILLADDNLVVLKVMSLKLKSHGYTVVPVTSGAAVIRAVAQEMPDLIILDLNFPEDAGHGAVGWDGFKIMEWLSRFQEVSHIPIFVITAQQSPGLKHRCLGLGATAFFQKPVDFEKLLAAMDKALATPGGEAQDGSAFPSREEV